MSNKKNKKNLPCIINGVEYPSLVEGCSATGLDYGYARLKRHKKGNKFKIKVVKYYDVEVKEN